MTLKRLVLGVMIIAALTLTGCQMDAGKARDSVVTAYGFISDLQTKHLAACQAAPTTEICVAITRGVAIQRTAAAALNDYCSGPPLAGDQPYATGGPCSAQVGVEPRLSQALSDLNSVMATLKRLKG